MAQTAKTRVTAATPWGTATVVEEAKVAQRAGERRFATVCQLLEVADGERLVWIACTTDGTVRRGPVTLRAKDIERLVDALAKQPELARMLAR